MNSDDDWDGIQHPPTTADCDLGSCEFCGEPATHAEQWDEIVHVCDKCSVPGVGL